MPCMLSLCIHPPNKCALYSSSIHCLFYHTVFSSLNCPITKCLSTGNPPKVEKLSKS